MKPNQQKILRASKFALVGGLCFLLGKYVSFSAPASWAEDRYLELQNFSKVLNIVQQYYVEPVDTKKLIYGAIRGMLRELDPHTNFLPPDIFKDFETETSGEFGGLGIEISLQNGILTIISPIEDAPAWVAGVKAGDKVIAVDDKTTKNLSLVEASQLMRGKKGTKVKLTVVREGEEQPRDIVIVRGNVRVRSVKYTDFEQGYAYIKITSFIENTGKDLEDTLKEHQKKSGTTKGVILDLRRNPGGLLEQAVKVSDMFLKDGAIVSTLGRDPTKKEVVSASKKGKYTDFPLIILVNEFSASASEIVAGALQDHKRAVILGTKSFGKGSVQSVVKLGDGSGLKLTIARYYTPSGKSIQADGIQPDIEVEDVDQETYNKSILKQKSPREKDISGHLLSDKEKAESKNSVEKISQSSDAWWLDKKDQKEQYKTPKEKLLSSDFQLYQAFNYIKAWKLMKGLDEKRTL
jgi:carboxyl-terminal processing protease